MIIGIDPSSTAIGVAVLSGLGRGDIVTGEVIRPSRRLTHEWRHCAWVKDHYRRSDLKALVRSLNAIDELLEMIGPYDQSGLRIVVETPSGKVGTGAKRGARGSLTSYGLAAGMVFAALRTEYNPVRVLPVSERQWTAGRGSKARRQREVMIVYGSAYDHRGDKGGDVADAIGIARWYLNRVQVMERVTGWALAAGLNGRRRRGTR